MARTCESAVVCTVHDRLRPDVSMSWNMRTCMLGARRQRYRQRYRQRARPLDLRLDRWDIPAATLLPADAATAVDKKLELLAGPVVR